MSFEFELPEPTARPSLDRLDAETKRRLAGTALPGNPADMLARDPGVAAHENPLFGPMPIDQQTLEQQMAFYEYMVERAVDILAAHQAMGGGSRMKLDTLLVTLADSTARERTETMSAILWANWNGQINLIKLPGSSAIIVEPGWRL